MHFNQVTHMPTSGHIKINSMFWLDVVDSEAGNIQTK